MNLADAIPPAPSWMRSDDLAVVRTLEPIMQAVALDHAAALHRQGVRLQFNSGRRSEATQAELVRRAEAGEAGIFTPQKPGASLHQYGLAYDGEPVPKSDATWDLYGRAAEALGMEWGGRYQRPDRPHVELPGKADLWRQLAGAGVLLVVTVGVARLVVRLLEGGKAHNVT